MIGKSYADNLAKNVNSTSYLDREIEKNLSKSHLYLALEALGYKTLEEKRSFIQLYHLTGALSEDGTIPESPMKDDQIDGLMSWFNWRSQTPTQIVDWLNKRGQRQRSSMRPGNSERQQMIGNKQFSQIAKHALDIIDISKKLGFTEEVILQNPFTNYQLNKKDQIDTLVILGSSQDHAQRSINYLGDLIEHNIIATPKNILLLTGERDFGPADSENKTQGETITSELVFRAVKNFYQKSTGDEVILDQEETKKLIQNKFEIKLAEVKDSSQVMQKRQEIIDQFLQLYPGMKWPTETDLMIDIIEKNYSLKNIPLTVVNAPKIYDPQSKTLLRPNTQSTLDQAVRDHNDILTDKNVVIFSPQPHFKYQFGLAANTLTKTRPESLTGISSSISVQGVDKTESEISVYLVEAFYSSVYANLNRAKDLLKLEEKLNVKSNNHEL